jgi:hypothetical protein
VVGGEVAVVVGLGWAVVGWVASVGRQSQVRKAVGAVVVGP